MVAKSFKVNHMVKHFHNINYWTWCHGLAPLEELASTYWVPVCIHTSKAGIKWINGNFIFSDTEYHLPGPYRVLGLAGAWWTFPAPPPWVLLLSLCAALHLQCQHTKHCQASLLTLISTAVTSGYINDELFHLHSITLHLHALKWNTVTEQMSGQTEQEIALPSPSV